MMRPWEEALRSLARRVGGPVGALAYGVTRTPEGEETRTNDLGRLLREHGFLSCSPVIVERDESGTGATNRPRFQQEVLGWIGERRRPTSVRTSDEALVGVFEAREKLLAVSKELDDFLDGLPADPLRKGETQLREGPGVTRKEAPKAPKSSREMPLVLVEHFEDLGSDAESVASAIEAIVLRGAHLVLPLEGIDTRTREGRGRTALSIRLGCLKAVGARERSLRELEERRRGLDVYGPIPFGFERQGPKLVPLPDLLKTVTRAKELSGRGLGPFEIAHALNRESCRWKDGSSWTGRRVGLVLRNPIYNRTFQEEIA